MVQDFGHPQYGGGFSKSESDPVLDGKPKGTHPPGPPNLGTHGGVPNWPRLNPDELRCPFQPNRPWVSMLCKNRSVFFPGHHRSCGVKGKPRGHPPILGVRCFLPKKKRRHDVPNSASGPHISGFGQPPLSLFQTNLKRAAHQAGAFARASPTTPPARLGSKESTSASPGDSPDSTRGHVFTVDGCELRKNIFIKKKKKKKKKKNLGKKKEKEKKRNKTMVESIVPPNG